MGGGPRALVSNANSRWERTCQRSRKLWPSTCFSEYIQDKNISRTLIKQIREGSCCCCFFFSVVYLTSGSTILQKLATRLSFPVPQVTQAWNKSDDTVAWLTLLHMFHIFPAQFLSRIVAIYQFHLVQHYSFITFKLTKGKDCLIGESAFCNMEGGRRALVSDVDSPWECTCQGTRMSTFFPQ